MIYYIADCTLLEPLLSQKWKDVSLKQLYLTEMEHESTTTMFTMLYKDFSCSKVKQICFYVPKNHTLFTEMKHETRTIMFTMLYKAFSCSKVEHRNETRNHNRNVYNDL